MSGSPKDLVFIASGGRTGTNFFGEVLGQIIDDCHSAHEPEVLQTKDLLNLNRLRTFGPWEMVFGRLLGMTGTRVLGTRLMMGDIDPQTVFRRMRASRHRWHARVPERLIVESNGPVWFLSAHLDDIWPGCKLIGIVRDPRTWVRSFINHEGRYDSRDWVDWFPPGRLTPAKLGKSEFAGQWDGWGTFEKLAWEWSVVNGELARGVERHPRARMWRFEDLFGGDTRYAEDLVTFAADHGSRRYAHRPVSTVMNRKINASAGSAPDWNLWSPAQARHVEATCGDLMRRFGYGTEPEWQALLDG